MPYGLRQCQSRGAEAVPARVGGAAPRRGRRSGPASALVVVLSGYLTLPMPVAGSLGDLSGRRRVFAAGDRKDRNEGPEPAPTRIQGTSAELV
ncbi:hypothetical protein GCM10010156_77650 [Planobispora rosea]|uniref:Uncharacterized protein n=1 Tax=Planobispora rosea TaxID=35762 RepID=A0A8J3SAZ9_PLARO|nr:hypothetical protein GCM10010156_77650 [Planobispora rosea]GIH89271.1 hypothetical protein Pro02_76790 [Planobispora rosea]